mgnify:CR=1 FL=1
MNLREFRALELAKLFEIEKKLQQKYGNDEKKVERIKTLVQSLAAKIYNLRTFTLADFLFTVHQYAAEFEEFAELMPSVEVVKELLKSDE